MVGVRRGIIWLYGMYFGYPSWPSVLSAVLRWSCGELSRGRVCICAGHAACQDVEAVKLLWWLLCVAATCGLHTARPAVAHVPMRCSSSSRQSKHALQFVLFYMLSCSAGFLLVHWLCAPHSCVESTCACV